jgi:hypothetical protein
MGINMTPINMTGSSLGSRPVPPSNTNQQPISPVYPKPKPPEKPAAENDETPNIGEVIVILNKGGLFRGCLLMEDKKTLTLKLDTGCLTLQKEDIKKIYRGGQPASSSKNENEDPSLWSKIKSWVAFD